MTNYKTSQFPTVSNLGGGELVPILQNGYNVQTTTGAIANIALQKDQFSIGKSSNITHGSGERQGHNLAIGYDTKAYAYDTTAIGAKSVAICLYGTIVGYNSQSVFNYAPVVIGSYSKTTSFATVVGAYSSAIGTQGGSFNNYSSGPVVVGHASNSYKAASVSIGSNIQNYAERTTIIGNKSNVSANCMGVTAIGYKITFPINNSSTYGVTLGYRSAVGYKSVAVGYFSGEGYYSSKSVALGYRSIAVNNSVAVGYGARVSLSGKNGTALGSYARCNSNYAVAVGEGAYSVGYSVAIGNYVAALGQNSVSIGNRNSTQNSFSVVIGGNANNNEITDLVSGSFNIIGYENVGTPVDRYQRFIGVTTSDTTIILTSDGMSPSSNNVPIFAPNTMGNITVRVTAADNNFLAGAGSVMTWTLTTPWLLYRQNSIYMPINAAPIFDIENNPNISGWPTPLIYIDETSGNIYISVTGVISTTINWMAHLKIETNG